MAKKRGHHEGSLHKRENGTWRAQVTVQGRRLSHTAGTKPEALAWIRKTLDQVDVGLTYKAAQLRVQRFLQDWLVSIENSVRPNTYRQYEQHVRMHISPHLGKYKLKDLKPKHIQRRYNEMVKQGYGLRTIRVTHAVIHRALGQAVKLGLIARNPSEATIPPKYKPSEMNFLDQDQANRLLVTAKATGDKYYPLYHLAISTGLRQGELIALKWADLDWERHTLQVHRQLTRAKAGGFEFTEPKTRAGKRTIALGATSLDLLKEHRQNQAFLMQVAGARWKENDLIFSSSIGTPLDKYNLLKSFKAILKQANLPDMRFHDLRHTAASLMLNNGIPVIVVSRRLGHARPSITLDVYGHLIPGKQQEVAALMDELLTPISVGFS